MRTHCSQETTRLRRLTPMRPPVSRGQTDASRGRGGRPKKHLVNQAYQAFAADLISSAGHSLGLHQTPIEDRCFGDMSPRETVVPRELRPRNSSVPSCRSSRSGGLCRKTLLVRFRLGRGAAATDLATDHQENERERQSNRGLGLRAFYPATPSQSTLYIRKERAKGSALDEPVRR